MGLVVRFSRRFVTMVLYCLGVIDLWLYRLQYKRDSSVDMGKNIRVFGFSFFKFNGKVRIGDNATFTSLTRINPVGLFRCCTVFVSEFGELSIGENNGFSGISIVCCDKIVIGDNCNFGGNVSIWDTDFHPLNYLDRRIHEESKIVCKPIVIGDDVFVGANSIILKGVVIGDRSIIGAGSVVTRNIPSDEIWAGNPVQFVRKI